MYFVNKLLMPGNETFVIFPWYRQMAVPASLIVAKFFVLHKVR